MNVPLQTMFETFSIVASLKPADQQGGFLFAVVTPGDSLVSLGLSITAAPALGMQEVGGPILKIQFKKIFFI